MKRGELTNKGIAAAVTVGFMAVVRPDPMPSLVEAAFITVLMYEVVRWCVWYVRQIRQQKRDKRYITLTKRDMRRWADEWITPAIREVR
jgi:hypothetical protein